MCTQYYADLNIFLVMTYNKMLQITERTNICSFSKDFLDTRYLGKWETISMQHRRKFTEKIWKQFCGLCQ